MGQKVHPYGLRLGIIRQSRSRWFAEGARYRKQLVEDLKVRRLIERRHVNAGISDVIIERTGDLMTVTIWTAKPGVIIGRGGQDVELLRQEIEKLTDARVRVNVEETPDPDINAQVVAQNIAQQIERRISYRRAMRQAVDRAMKLGAQGIRVAVSGRLGGAEIARTESVGPEGRVPLHTLRADVQYGFAEAKTTYGNIGVKVWTYRGDILPDRRRQVAAEEPEEVEAAEGRETAAGVEEAAQVAAGSPPQASEAPTDAPTAGAEAQPAATGQEPASESAQSTASAVEAADTVAEPEEEQ